MKQLFAAFLLLLSLLAGGEARTNPAFKSFDDTMTTYMTARGIPGGAVAVVKDGRLVYTKGYGWADKRVPVTPTSLFRIASISKPVTAAAYGSGGTKKSAATPCSCPCRSPKP